MKRKETNDMTLNTQRVQMIGVMREVSFAAAQFNLVLRDARTVVARPPR